MLCCKPDFQFHCGCPTPEPSAGLTLDAEWAIAQVVGDTAEARIMGKLRLLQKLVDGVPKQQALPCVGGAPAKAQGALAETQDAGVGLPPAYHAWESLQQRAAKFLLAGVIQERFNARCGVMQASLRLMLDALAAGTPLEAAGAAGDKPYEVCCCNTPAVHGAAKAGMLSSSAAREHALHGLASLCVRWWSRMLPAVNKGRQSVLRLALAQPVVMSDRDSSCACCTGLRAPLSVRCERACQIFRTCICRRVITVMWSISHNTKLQHPSPPRAHAGVEIDPRYGQTAQGA